MDFLLRTAAQRVVLPSRHEVMHVYRRILKQARSFFDETTREFIQTYAKETFRRNLYDRKVNRARAKLRNAKTTANRLERANKHRFKDVLNVLETGYGQKGPRKAMMLEAMVGIKKEEEVFGNLRDMAQYRPAFYALAMYQLGRNKVEVDKQNIKSLHPLNVAKTQDSRWETLRYKVAPPVDAATMEVLEERARTGIIRNPAFQDCSVRDAALIRRWEEKWVHLPHRRQICRYYRTLLESISMMVVTTRMVPNKSKYLKSRARKNTDIAPGVEKPEFVPEKTYSFVKSIYAGKKEPQEASIIDVAGIADQSVAVQF